MKKSKILRNLGSVALVSLITILSTAEATSAQNLSNRDIANASCAAYTNTSLSKGEVERRMLPVNARRAGRTSRNGPFEIDVLRVLQYIGRNSGTSNTRKFSTPERGARFNLFNVEPDGIASVGVLNTRGNVVFYRRSLFADARYRASRLSISSDDGQAFGFLEHLSLRSPAAIARLGLRRRQRPTPALAYISPDNFRIGGSIIQEANRREVALYQHMMCGKGPTITGRLLAVPGWGVLLNTEVFANSATPLSTRLPFGNPSLTGLDIRRVP